MPTNDQVLLDSVLADRSSEWEGDPPPEDEAFELFCFQAILKQTDLSADETLAGQIGGSGDGGIDGVYVLLEGASLEPDADVLDDDFDTRKVEKGAEIRLIAIQAKRTPSFSEKAVQLISDTLNLILDLNSDDDSLSEFFSPELLERAKIFRTAWRNIAPRHPELRVEVHYATKGDTGSINAAVKARAGQLVSEAEATSTKLQASVVFEGARELLTLDSVETSYTLTLPFAYMIDSSAGHVMLVRLADYFGFISENGTLHKHIFDWNVRDFEGNVEVNKEIAGSLGDKDAPDFWWLNNGITVICSEASSANKVCSMDDVQVVNGLQSSVSIFNHLVTAKEDDPARDRLVLVRAIATQDPAVRDKIVRATNRQTAVQQASLRASDPIQRDLEMFFLNRSWFYERRKNYYRNQGKPSQKIISIPYLAQTASACGFSDPSNSRARPSSLLKRDEDYERIFDRAIPYEVYFWLAQVQRFIDITLRSANFPQKQATNLRFHLAMLVVASLHGNRVYHPKQLADLTETSADSENLGEPLIEASKFVVGAFDGYFGETKQDPSIEQAVKSQAFTAFLLDRRFPEGDS
jgi:AIPR protein